LTRVHFLRRIRHTQDTWVHCGRPQTVVRSTETLALVTCRLCARYVAKGLAYGFREATPGDVPSRQ
jgi:ribosomal protein S14